MELSQIVIDQPERAWTIIRRINEVSIDSPESRNMIQATVGCGPLEDLIALHEKAMLSQILAAAETDQVLRRELEAIYASSISAGAFAAIQACVRGGTR